FKKSGYHTVVIPNSIEIAKYPFKLRDQPAARLLWVRSFHKQYDPQMAADVLAKLLRNEPDATLCMVGPDKDGSMEEFRKYIRQNGIENNVKITGRITKDEWIRLSGNYDFFLNTTNVDNTPVSVIEAMALGMCVISTNPGGIPYLLTEGKDALLVRPGDYQAMADKISSLIDDPNLATTLSKLARQKAESFDWNQVREKWLGLLK
ncbi:MAG: glycosyltransferase, partial [Bacteroidales bacterium]|nr:glycosyltransferase [Bacteroidales bacterium]